MAGQQNPTNGFIEFAIVWSEPVSGLAASGITLGADASLNTGSARFNLTAADSQHYGVLIWGLAGTGKVWVSVKTKACADAARNLNAAIDGSAVAVTFGEAHFARLDC